jgi:hypothetical protein
MKEPCTLLAALALLSLNACSSLDQNDRDMSMRPSNASSPPQQAAPSRTPPASAAQRNSPFPFGE